MIVLNATAAPIATDVLASFPLPPETATAKPPAIAVIADLSIALIFAEPLVLAFLMSLRLTRDLTPPPRMVFTAIDPAPANAVLPRPETATETEPAIANEKITALDEAVTSTSPSTVR